MADTHDTINGLIAEFRGYSAGMPASHHVMMSWADFRRMLDCFEAALKRERAKIEADALAVGGIVEAERKRERGDCAKLREALKLCAKGMCGFCIMDAEARGMSTECVNGCEALRKAKAALAAPPRNCDKYATYNDAMQAFDAFVREQGKLGFINLYTESFKWLFASATEKKGDNDAD